MHNTGQDITEKECRNIHGWLKKTYGKASCCERCNTKIVRRYQWALKKGCMYEYDIDNFMQLCASCHKKYDMTDETRAKISAAMKQRMVSSETRAKISASTSAFRKGKHHTVETRAKLSVANRNRKVSNETRAKLSAARLRWIKHRIEHGATSVQMSKKSHEYIK